MTSVRISQIAWALLLINNLAQLVLALIHYQSLHWLAVAPFLAVPFLFIAWPSISNAREKHWSWIETGVSLFLWLPAAAYCVQFWSPDRGG